MNFLMNILQSPLWLADLNADSDFLAPAEDANEEKEEFDLEPPPQKITKYKDAIAALA